MRRPTRFVGLLAILAAALALPGRGVAQVRLFINGERVDSVLVQTNGTLYVPLAIISRIPGVQVTIETNAPAAVASAPATVTAPSPVAPAPAAAPPVTITITPPGARRIAGVLSWRNNLFDIHHADAGARIWLLTAAQANALAKAARGTDAEPIPDAASGWTERLEREFGAASAVADATGGFAFDNPAAGRYLLVFESHAANGLAARDRTGKVRFRTLEVPPGGTVDASFNFGPTAYRQP